MKELFLDTGELFDVMICGVHDWCVTLYVDRSCTALVSLVCEVAMSARPCLELPGHCSVLSGFVFPENMTLSRKHDLEAVLALVFRALSVVFRPLAACLCVMLPSPTLGAAASFAGALWPSLAAFGVVGCLSRLCICVFNAAAHLVTAACSVRLCLRISGCWSVAP